VLKVIQSAKCDNQNGGWKRQWSHASRTLRPIRAGEEKKDHWHEQHDGELENMPAVPSSG
jgi:hypothetical protein